LENLRGRSSRPTNNLWLNTPSANSTAATTIIAVTIATAVATAAATAAAFATAAAVVATTSPAIAANTSTTEEAAVPANDAQEDDSPSVDNPGLNTGGDTAEGASHVQKIQHWKQKIKDMQGTSVEIKSKNQMGKWTVIEDVDPSINNGPPERPNLGIQDFDYNNIPRDEVFALMFFHFMWIGIDEQIIKFNAAIDEHNESLPVSR
jgi:hypothetical protein